MRASASVLLLCAAIVTVACTRPAPPEAVPGTYVMNRGQAADTLVVLVDGRYWRRYVPPVGAAAVDTGRWEYDTMPGDAPRVSFARFPVRWQAETFPPDTTWRIGPPGWWPPEVEQTWRGQVRLPVDSDLGWAYERIGAAHPQP